LGGGKKKKGDSIVVARGKKRGKATDHTLKKGGKTRLFRDRLLRGGKKARSLSV